MVVLQAFAHFCCYVCKVGDEVLLPDPNRRVPTRCWLIGCHLVLNAQGLDQVQVCSAILSLTELIVAVVRHGSSQ